MLRWHYAVITDSGCQRTNNQDAFYTSPDRRVFVVCDGMGVGTRAAGVSQLAVATVASIWHKNPPHQTDGAAIRQWIADAINSANEAIYTSAKEDTSLQGMGSTIVIAVQSTNKFVEVGHVGDSRAYLFHRSENNKCPLFLLTDDHSEPISTADRGHHPYLTVTRVLGQKAQIEGSYATVQLCATDWLILCTDGLTTVLMDEQISQIISKSAKPDEACKELVAQTIDGGAPDNTTLIAIQYYKKDDGNDEPTAPVPLKPKPRQQDTEISLSLPDESR